MSDNVDKPKSDMEGDTFYYIQLGVHLTGSLGMKSVTIDCNTTSLPSDSELIKKVAFTMLRALQLNKEDLALQDLLNELDIGRQR